MKDYVMNTSPVWMHIMKRNIGPGGKIPLSELYEQYGKKHSIKKGKDFIEWLKAVKIKNSKTWKIVLKEEATDDVVKEIQESVKLPIENTGSNVVPPVTSELSVQDVVMFSVRQGREMLPKITDLKLLKYAFQEANQLAGKDSLCNIIRKRIKDLELGR